MTDHEVDVLDDLFEPETALLERELRRNHTAPRLDADTVPDEATEALRDTGRKTIADMDANADARRRDPVGTKCRLLRITALLALDRMMLDPFGVSREWLQDPAG